MTSDYTGAANAGLLIINALESNSTDVWFPSSSVISPVYLVWEFPFIEGVPVRILNTDSV